MVHCALRIFVHRVGAFQKLGLTAVHGRSFANRSWRSPRKELLKKVGRHLSPAHCKAVKACRQVFRVVGSYGVLVLSKPPRRNCLTRCRRKAHEASPCSARQARHARQVLPAALLVVHILLELAGAANNEPLALLHVLRCSPRF